MINTAIFVYESTTPDIYRNQAAEELLFRRAMPGEVYLYLWRNDNTIVIGRNQDAWRECDVALCKAEGCRIARRLSGGGAVYHDMNNINFTFTACKDWYDTTKHTEVIRLAARSFGIDAKRDGRNDILAEGRKFSGNAYYQQDDHCYHHGTILIATDMARLGRYLRPHPEKLAGKGVASVTSRVINLRDICPSLTIPSMYHALINAFECVYGASVIHMDERELPADEWDSLTARYASAAWRLRDPLPYTARLSKRFDFGEIDMHLCVAGGIITQAEVYSDAMDANLAPSIAAALNAIPYTNTSIRGAMSQLSSVWPAEINAILGWIRAEPL